MDTIFVWEKCNIVTRILDTQNLFKKVPNFFSAHRMSFCTDISFKETKMEKYISQALYKNIKNKNMRSISCGSSKC